MAVGRVIQCFFYEQWRALRLYCAQRSIRVVGDIAIFVDYDSADVWANREMFRLKDDLEPEAVSGVPPDAFSETGQRWGNPLYDWNAMRSQGYKWWVQRLRWATQTCDFIRLDHFRGFAQFWEIPASEPTAINGRWVDGPKDELFNKLREELGGLPFFAEDLGYITPGRARTARTPSHSRHGGVAVWLWRPRRAHVSAASSDYRPRRSTPVLTTMTRLWAGGIQAQPTTSAGPRTLTSEIVRTESTGPSSARSRPPWPAFLWPLSGRSWPGQRSPLEHSERKEGKLSLAIPAGIAEASNWPSVLRASLRSPTGFHSQFPCRQAKSSSLDLSAIV